MKSDKSHDTTKPRRYRIIYSDEATLRVIGMLIPEAVGPNTYRSDEQREVWDGTYYGRHKKKHYIYENVGPVTNGVFKMTMDEWKYLQSVLVNRKLTRRLSEFGTNGCGRNWDLV